MRGERGCKLFDCNYLGLSLVPIEVVAHEEKYLEFLKFYRVAQDGSVYRTYKVRLLQYDLRSYDL